MSFYFFCYSQKSRRTIHQADCRFCKQGSIFQRSVDLDSKGSWVGPFSDYQQTLIQAQQAGKDDKTLMNCRHCHPEQFINISDLCAQKHYLKVTQKQERIYNEGCLNEKLNDVLLNHGRELLAFRALSVHFQELMGRRHKFELSTLAVNDSSGKLVDALARQHLTETQEFNQDQAQRLHHILERQALELAALEG